MKAIRSRRDAKQSAAVAPLPRALILALVVASLVTPMAAAQGQSGVTVDQIDTSAFPTVRALVTVQDANGVPEPDLLAGAFEIVEDGRFSFPPAQLNTQVNPDAVVSIALVVDLSGSMQGKPLEEAQAASRNLLDALLDRGDDQDRVAFFGINRMVKPDDLTLDEAVEVPFGNDKNKVLNVVNFLKVEGNRPTPLYDALFRVVKLTAEQGGRRGIIIITDGVDRVSQLAAEDPITEANRNNIPVFPISLSTNTVDRDFLRRLAVRTGGTYREAPSPEEFSGLFQQVLDQLKLQYKLEYSSRLTEDGQPHSLLVRVRAPRVQGFDETKFILNKAPVATTASNIATLATTVAEPVAAVATPSIETPAEDTGEKGMQGFIDDVVDFVKDNPLPAALIALAVLLLIVLLVLLIIWLRRRKADQAQGPAADYGGSDEWQASMPAAPAVSPGGFQTSPKGAALPTMIEGASPTAAPTVGSGSAPPAAPPPFPVGGQGAAPRMGADQVEGTRVLTRAPKHVALLIDRKNPSQRFDLLAATDIGRAQTNNVVIADVTVSRQHARIRLEEDKFLLFDLGSANGTFVNDQRVEQPITLAENDVVRFGEVAFIFKQLS